MKDVFRTFGLCLRYRYNRKRGVLVLMAYLTFVGLVVSTLFLSVSVTVAQGKYLWELVKLYTPKHATFLVESMEIFVQSADGSVCTFIGVKLFVYDIVLVTISIICLIACLAMNEFWCALMTHCKDEPEEAFFYNHGSNLLEVMQRIRLEPVEFHAQFWAITGSKMCEVTSINENSVQAIAISGFSQTWVMHNHPHSRRAVMSRNDIVSAVKVECLCSIVVTSKETCVLYLPSQELDEEKIQDSYKRYLAEYRSERHGLFALARTLSDTKSADYACRKVAEEFGMEFVVYSNYRAAYDAVMTRGQALSLES